MKKINVMHVLTDTNVGGAGTLLYNMIACGDTERFRYFVVLPLGSRLIPRFMGLSCRVLTVSHGQDRSLDARAIGEYVALIRKIRPAVVHTHGALGARIAGRLCGVPVCITTRHCVFPLKSYQKNALWRRAFSLGTRALSDHVIAVAEAARVNLLALGADGGEIDVIQNGVLPVRRCDAEETALLRQGLGIEPTDFVVGMAARLESYKGQEIVLHAAAKLIVNFPDFLFLFMGDGAERQKYEALARDLGIADRVIFTGFVEDMAPFWGLVRVNVNASWGTETSSLSLSEGMSLGIPSVASDYGGNPGMITDGENGLLFPTGDADALAACLLRLYSDRELYDALSHGASERFRRELTAEKMTKSVESLYLRMLAQKSGKTRRNR